MTIQTHQTFVGIKIIIPSDRGFTEGLFQTQRVSFSAVTWILPSLLPQTLASRLYINGRKQRNSPGQTDKQKDSWRKLSQNYLLQNST